MTISVGGITAIVRTVLNEETQTYGFRILIPNYEGTGIDATFTNSRREFQDEAAAKEGAREALAEIAKLRKLSN